QLIQEAESTDLPILKTPEQMAAISGIGRNRLLQMMDKRELEYVLNGNRRLIADKAIMDWYERNKITVEVE
ncbi:hypothetical protein LJC61_02360, partial [Ruminococcaceae bacterium OttesenSCG-928-A16]|nr:hypothetical protein [Ruminococcaceae bacterium OttesenSCG-928-A16]